MTHNLGRNLRRLFQTLAVVVLAATTTVCSAGVSAPKEPRTVYVFANYATPAPSLTVAVNGTSIGQISKQYTGSTDCTQLGLLTAASGVLAFQVSYGTHYDIAWTYAGGKSDKDSFDPPTDLDTFPCLLEPIGAPAP